MAENMTIEKMLGGVDLAEVERLEEEKRKKEKLNSLKNFFLLLLNMLMNLWK